MDGKKLNEDIILGIKDNCKNDLIMKNFLFDIINEEISRPPNWRWKDTYKKHIEKAIRIWVKK